MTQEFIDFVLEHRHDDTARLLFSASRYPDIDMPLAVNQIEGQRTAEEKWPSLLNEEAFLYPPRLNREQASSEATAHYKASLTTAVSVTDLTGGMGIDTLAFARGAGHVDYVEHENTLCSLMEHNCHVLGISNIRCHCSDSLAWLETQELCDLIYIDPARRSASGRKVTAFEDCTPDILPHLDILYRHCKQLLVKASPMIDIHLAIKQLGRVEEVHVVAVKGECKEVLFLCGKPTDDPLLHCVNIQGTNAVETFSFRRSEEQAAGICHTDTVGLYLYDPHAALRKAQCFHLPAQRYNLSMLAPNTHLYTSDERVPDFPGRTFKVLCEVPLNRKAVKEGLPDGKAHVVVRNFPAEAATLQKQLGLSEGGDLFVIATTVGTRRLGLLCQAV